MEPASAEGSLFARGLRDLGLPYLDARRPLLMLTTYNEWHEWSQTEPAQPTPDRPPTAADQPYTVGFPHPGYRLRYLGPVMLETK